MTKTSPLKLAAHVVFALGVAIYARELTKIPDEVPPPFKWERIERDFTSGPGVPPAVALLPSWMTRYATYPDRFGKSDFFTWQEVTDGRTLPHTGIWLVDVNGKMRFFKKNPAKRHEIKETFRSDDAVVYLAKMRKPPATVYGPSLNNLEYRVEAYDTAKNARTTAPQALRPARARFEGLSRSVLQMEVRAGQVYDIRIQRPPGTGRLHLYAGIDDEELYRKREDHSEVEVDIRLGEAPVARRRIRNLLGMRGYDFELRGKHEDEILLRLTCVNGEIKKCSLLVFLTPD